MNIDELYTLEHHENGVEMNVNDENGEPTELFIKVVGIDSKQYRTARTKMLRAIVNDKDSDENEIRAQAMAETSIGWRGALSKGKDIPFSKEVVKDLYLNAPYIMDQFDKFISNRINFSKG